ncbi:hypothetical protein BGX20_000326 [Mortierella sp. AD010]|nr:hypothetical protein BGX20_000326 [Mortierella sp. AD010]
MSFFKFNGASSSSKKNKTVSASNTPRTSVQLSSADIPEYKETLMTAEVAFERLAKKDNLRHLLLANLKIAA